MQYPGAIENFSGGLVDDLREPQSDRFGLSKHFDIFSNPYRLTPYRSTTAESDATSVAHLKTFNLQNFQLGKSGKMYALGLDATTHPQVYEKADPTTGNWAPSTTGAGANALVRGSFLEFGTTNALWMFSGTNKISKYATASNTFTDTVASISASIITVAQSIVGSDGNMYMFYNNQVVRVSPAGAVTDQVLTNLPSDMRIQCAVRWGSYIGICMAYGTSATAAPVGVSKMFVWDMVTTTTVNDVIDLGEGAVMCAANLEGMVATVSNKFIETPSGLTSLAIGQGSLVVRIWNGANAKIMKEVVTNQAVTLGRFIRDVVVKDNKMYFVASLPLAPDSTSTESTYALGIWAYGRKNSSLPFALTLDYIEEGIDTANYKINSFGAAGNYWFINHSADGSVSKTDSAANYTFTSIFESPIFNFIFGLRHRHIPDSSVTKKLQGVTLTFDPLPAGATAVLKYRADAETAWTQIFTYTSTNGISHSAINIESSGTTLPEYKEIQFRFESTGGAIITGFKFVFEQESKDLYD